MRFKLDEDLPRELADDLRRVGHDPDSIVEEGLSGAKDRTVLQAARTAGRVLLTLDKRIASLLQHPVHEHAGVVLFRPDTAGRRAGSSFVRSRRSAPFGMGLSGRPVFFRCTPIF